MASRVVDEAEFFGSDPLGKSTRANEAAAALLEVMGTV
jgi:hypothetical protein